MTDEQIIIDELKNENACKENIINHLAEHNIKLQVQFKEKEQECEYWKHQAELGLDTTDSLVKELEEKEQECEELKEKVKKYGEINEQETKDYAELKAENEELKERFSYFHHPDVEFEQERNAFINEIKKNNKLKQTLAEIKEIITTALEQNTLINLDKILQKINEVEDE
jgi:hypothetical protein